MDYVLFVLLIFNFLRGVFKGFLSMLFSVFGVVVVAFVAWQCADSVAQILQNLFGANLSASIQTFLDSKISGSFSDLNSLQEAISNSSYAMIFNVFLSKILQNLTIEGSLSAGEILSPTISALVCKVVAFLCLFFLMFVFLKIVVRFANKIIKKIGFSTGNRILGGLFGLVKGLLIFGILYFSLSALANVTLSTGLANFVQSGQISNFLYENFISKIIDLIY